MANRRPYVEIILQNVRRKFKSRSPDQLSISDDEESSYRRKKQKVHIDDRTDTESEGIFPPSTALQDDAVMSDAIPGEDDEGTILYQPAIDEVTETEETVVPGETPADEDDPQIPVRTLNDFTIYDAHTNALVSINELLNMDTSGREFSASGIAGPWVEADDSASLEGSLFGDDSSRASQTGSNEENADSTLRLKLDRIIDFNVHHISEMKIIDSKIYLETDHSWYILLVPSTQYASFFSEFWVDSRICNLCLVSCVQNPRITLDHFIAGLRLLDQEEDVIRTSFDILGRDLVEDDFSVRARAYTRRVLTSICSKNKLDIARVPLVREIVGAKVYTFEPEIRMRAGSDPPSENTPTAEKTSKTSTKDKTFLTPIVSRIAEKLFEASFDVAESLLDQGLENKQLHQAHQAHPYDPDTIIWGQHLGSNKYSSVTVDNVLYKIGDIVMVEPDAKWLSDQPQSSCSVNFFGDQYWFCQIRHFFDGFSYGVSSKMFHGIWFSHGSKTLLQETSHSRALYLLRSCDNNFVSSIFQKCNLAILSPDQEEPPDDQEKKANDFHCSLLYNPENGSFIDIPSNALQCGSPGPVSCFSCDIKKSRDEAENIFYPQVNSITIQNLDYHCQDFVYIHPSGTGDKELLIGQIKAIKETGISIQYLEHYHDFVQLQREKDTKDSKCQLVLDEKRLFLTNYQSIIDPSKIDGKCFVLHLTSPSKITQWTAEDDHYYLKQQGSTSALLPMDPTDFSFCKICYQAEQQKTQLAENFLLQNSKLVGMELFSGAGGLGVGMNMSGFVETKYAIEYAASAAKTYQKNHPETTVYCQDSSALLKQAVKISQNPTLQVAPLPSLDPTTSVALPALPSLDEKIDFIFGGPPCQSFSLANHSKKADDIRSTIPCNMLSYAEHYNPSYFLLENVYGFVLHKFYSRKTTKSGVVESIIEFGMIKLVTRTLIALGYQVHYKLLQAAQYGVPQSRHRIIFWAAKRGLILPEFPVPVYAYPKGNMRISLPTGEKLMPPTRSKNPDRHHQFAPLRPVTVDMAIGDLPKFEWKNPGLIIPLPQVKATKALSLEKDMIFAFHAVTTADNQHFDQLPGFPRGVSYALEPQSSFQKWMRADMGDGDIITGHYTAWFHSKIVEATVNVPMIPLATHRDLPAILLPAFARKHTFKRVLYGRLDPQGFFRCAVTQLSPVLHNQYPLHPTQKRIISVREAARCQGFPDWYEFESTSTKAKTIISDQLKQIGNAVAVPFALALGRELGKALVSNWERESREESVGL